MSDKTPDPALAKLLKRREQLNAQIKAKNARIREQERKLDTRRKIIAGALALEHAGTHPDGEFAAQMFKLLNRYVTKPNERALFDLPPRDDQANDTAKPAFNEGVGQ